MTRNLPPPRRLLAGVLLALAAPLAAGQEARPAAAGEEVELVRVESGDTFHVRRAGAVERVHLLSVDTEEPFTGRDASSRTKPQTPFGDECVRWVQAFLREHAGADGRTRIRLLFPGGAEQRDVYGRLLCHVLLADGTDLNLKLVREGKSPYFNKYGNSLVAHDAFVAAQQAAREGRLGIWSPDTNSGADPLGGPVEKRPYPELIAWWHARAEAIDGFRFRSAEDPAGVVSSEDPAALARAAQSPQREVLVFGEIARIAPEESGGELVVLRASDAARALGVRIPAAAIDAHRALELAGRIGTFRQNFFYVRGAVAQAGDALELVSAGPERWKLASPEPELPQ